MFSFAEQHMTNVFFFGFILVAAVLNVWPNAHDNFCVFFTYVTLRCALNYVLESMVGQRKGRACWICILDQHVNYKSK